MHFTRCVLEELPMISVPTVEERIASSRRHIEAGRLIIGVSPPNDRTVQSGTGRDTKPQSVFERDLADLEKA